ncbi:nuclear receptor subfamily 5 group A member 2-like isoform X1 [Boleophthalmus pectinirostris]|uniref:nuclear receptor subfamily 5 group A member 2-like isoform X1 n=1 Tax=Boleophthalmus pectinirostris TaxID=150288 RepID=UPI000A1C6458|nr:nuclear receptor subfamily 5 group A member 2-like isoform X1 [Boleophthalmus pectinirostris]
MDYSHTASEELCPVCGDKVSGYHYGLLTCESCKGFFKRTVQNKKRYMCGETQKCRIDKAQRKRCPFCRFQKCLEVGMRLDAVRADRMRGGRNKFGPMYKRDRVLKQQQKVQAELPKVTPHVQTDCTYPVRSGIICPSSLTVTPGTNHVHFETTHTREPLKPRVPLFVLELVRCDPDETLLQNKIRQSLQQHKHGLPSLFSLMFLLTEQTLLSMVEWARTSVYFRQLKVRDQMTLLHNCWSEMLLLDLISRQVLKGKEGRLLLITGHEIDFSMLGCHAGPILSSLIKLGQELIGKFQLLKVDQQEFVCIKYLIIFNPEGKQLENRLFIERVQWQVRGALLEAASSSQCSARFTQLLQCLSEIHLMSCLAEDYLWSKHESGEVHCNSLLTEMLHAKRSNA